MKLKGNVFHLLFRNTFMKRGEYEEREKCRLNGFSKMNQKIWNLWDIILERAKICCNFERNKKQLNGNNWARMASPKRKKMKEQRLHSEAIITLYTHSFSIRKFPQKCQKMKAWYNIIELKIIFHFVTKKSRIMDCQWLWQAPWQRQMGR